MKGTKRENWIDSLKGIAIICVVLGHILDGAMGKNLFPYSSWMQILYSIIYSFHMPLFFFLSGIGFSMAFVSKNRKFTEDGYKYVLNLLLLYIFWSGFMYFFKNVFSGLVNVSYEEKLLHCLLFSPVAPYWYLITLAYYYLIGFALIDSFQKKSLKCIVFTGALCILSGFLPILLPIENRALNYLYRIFYHIFFFMVGILLSEYKKEGRTEKVWVKSCLIIAIIFMYGNICGWKIEKIPFFKVLNASVMIFLILLLVKRFSILENNVLLCYFGKNSLYIYILHNYFTVLFRVIYQRMGIALPSEIYVLGNLILTLMCCGIAERVAHYIWLLNIFFQPVKTWQRVIEIFEIEKVRRSE